MVDKLKIDRSKMNDAQAAALSRSNVASGEIENTNEAIEFVLKAVAKALGTIRERPLGNLLALQTCVAMFENNPTFMFGQKELCAQAVAAMNGTRHILRTVVNANKTPDELVNGVSDNVIFGRLMGRDSQIVDAGLQNMVAFDACYKTAVEQNEKREENIRVANEANAKNARRLQLINKATNGTITPEEDAELSALRDAWRQDIAARSAQPMPNDMGETAEQVVDRAIAEGRLPKAPETTPPERVRELYIAAINRSLTDEEHVELGLEPPKAPVANESPMVIEQALTQGVEEAMAATDPPPPPEADTNAQAAQVIAAVAQDA